MQSRDQLAKLAQALGGIPVWGSLPGSPSHALGVRYGDVVLAVNGMRTSNIDDYLDARNLRTDGVEIRVFRDGAEIELSIDFEASDPQPPRALEKVAAEVVAARLLPSERPPLPPRDDDN